MRDFQCPGCRAFEAQDGPFLKKSLSDGDISIEYHPIAFLDPMSSTEYSSRALNAAMCVLDDKGVKAYAKMHDILYESQPEENSAGLPDSQLIKFAEQSGADDLSSCIKSRKFGPWVKKATEASRQAKIGSTPTIRIDGKEVTGPEQNGRPTSPRVVDLKKAIMEAKK